MWRQRIKELQKEKGLSNKTFAEKADLTVETLDRTLSTKHAKTDAPRLSTISNMCRALEVEVWEVFYTGEKSLVLLQAEIDSLKAERDNLIAENGALKEKVETLRDKNDILKDEVIRTHNHYIKLQSN